MEIGPAIKSPNQISKLKNENGAQATQEQILDMLLYMNGLLNNKFNEMVLVEASTVILKEFWFWKLEDVAMFVKLISRGRLQEKLFHYHLAELVKCFGEYEGMRVEYVHRQHEDTKTRGAMYEQPELNYNQRLGETVKRINENFNAKDKK